MPDTIETSVITELNSLIAEVTKFNYTVPAEVEPILKDIHLRAQEGDGTTSYQSIVDAFKVLLVEADEDGLVPTMIRRQFIGR